MDDYLLVQSTFLHCLKVIFCLYIGTNSITHLGSKFVFYSVRYGSQDSVIKSIFIDREARETMYLVASVRPSVCVFLCLYSQLRVQLNCLTYDLNITSLRRLSVCL